MRSADGYRLAAPAQGARRRGWALRRQRSLARQQEPDAVMIEDDTVGRDALDCGAFGSLTAFAVLARVEEHEPIGRSARVDMQVEMQLWNSCAVRCHFTQGRQVLVALVRRLFYRGGRGSQRGF